MPGVEDRPSVLVNASVSVGVSVLGQESVLGERSVMAESSEVRIPVTKDLSPSWRVCESVCKGRAEDRKRTG